MPTSQQRPVSFLGEEFPHGQIWLQPHLELLGFSAPWLQRMIRSGNLVRLRRGCYIDAKYWNSLGKREQSVQRLKAHALQTGRLLEEPGFQRRALEAARSSAGRDKRRAGSDGSIAGSDGSRPDTAKSPRNPRSGIHNGVYCDASAALLHDLYLWNIPPLIHLYFPNKRSTAGQPHDIRGHFRPVPSSDIVQVQGLPVTSLERTVLDCASNYEVRKGLIIADHALRLGANRKLMEDMLEAMRGRRGVRNARAVLEMADARSESPGETLSRLIILGSDLPRPEPQLEVQTRHGSHRLDFGWRQHKVALEFDGDSKYFDYAPTGDVLLAERKREKDLQEAGWIFVRLEWKDLFHPELVIRRIRTAIDQAARTAINQAA